MITGIRLRNFKSFREAAVPLDRFTVVLGANGAGKSNLFDALRFLKAIGQGRSVRDALEGRVAPGPTLAVVDGVRGGSSSAPYFGSDRPGFDLEVDLLAHGRRITYWVSVDTRRHRLVGEELRSPDRGGPYIYSTRPESGPLDPEPDGSAIPARFYKEQRGVNPKRDFSPYDFILTQFTGRKAESNLNEDVADAVRAERRAISPLELRPEVLRTYSTRGNAILGEHGENFAGAVADLLERAGEMTAYRPVSEGERATAQARLAAVLSWIDQVTPRGITSIRAESAPTGEVVFGVKESPFERVIPAPSLSDGTLRFAALAFAAIDPGPAQKTLVIEELENGVNPSRLPLLMQMLDQVTSADDTTQVIASTHSPAVLDSATDEIVQACVAVGWDVDTASSTVSRLVDLPGFTNALASGGMTLGEPADPRRREPSASPPCTGEEVRAPGYLRRLRGGS